MTTTLRGILDKYRAKAKSEREKGDYFEHLVKVWLENAPTQKDQFARVVTFGDWAKERREDQRDTGIDLCAQLADDPENWCAIQCKFYAHGYRMQKADIDSFFTASGKRPFTRRIIVDTTDAAWSEHAETALSDQIVPTIRIGLSDLEDSGIDWATFAAKGTVKLEAKKKIRPDQKEALTAVIEGLATADRGKLIMACGTGKTFTALKIAERIAGKGGRVLYLVPSLALMSQTVREWSIDTDIPIRSFAVCSDVQVGVRRVRNDDLADIDVHDLEIPATTLPQKLAAKANESVADRMTVVFSTYQSIQVISEAQKKFGLPTFDLIVCDEAHRTTGVTLSGDDESNFVRVHRQDFIAAKSRLYMTATPRIYGEGVQATAREVDAALCSMDDATLYGETLFTRNFSWAVQNGLLTDYKVIVLAVDEGAVSASIQRRLSDENSELLLDDATKIVGCYRALTKADLAVDVSGDTGPMHRALAFTRDIKSSKLFKTEFARVAEEWREHFKTENPDAALPDLTCQVDHVDGTFNATSRGQRLSWLKENTGEADICRILSNARCLSEGVDVPALDAIIFLHPRKSQIDVVQSVGRVMRRAEGKRMGYVILPVGVPAGVPPEDALDNNEKYKVVWQILNALRAHDDRLNATINKIEYGAHPGDRIEVVAVSNTMPDRTSKKRDGLSIGKGGGAGDLDPGEAFQGGERPAEQLGFQFDDFARAILSRIVKKCGTRTYWEDWAKDVAEIARKHVTRLTVAVSKAGSKEKAAFDAFLAELRDDLNDSVTADEAIEMLAQHMITRPVFDALFENYRFASQNPVSQAMQGVLDVLDKQNLEKEAKSLERFYASVRLRAAGIEDAEAKQRIVKELYDKFFRAAFPRLAERMGIVYTPIEIVDFIIKSVSEVLQSEFGQTLGSKGVHIIDPFTGTGTFITRLLQSGLIKPEELAHKYAHEIHANEILLLAYYIAAINIEATYHALSGGDYAPFPGICLTDTFQLYEKDDLISGLMADNSSRRSKQKKLPIRVVIGNPPYSVGQKSENDNNANVSYPGLDERIRETYAAQSNATLQKGLYDNYVRAIRWATDRLGAAGGIVGFVSNASWIEVHSADGLRKCLAEDFTRIDVIHLRGNARTSGDQRRREKDNVFGQGTRTPVAIVILTRNTAKRQETHIRFHDIGDFLTREQKLEKVSEFGSTDGVTERRGWRIITPDGHGDWIKQRDVSFDKLVPLVGKGQPGTLGLFENHSLGVATNRDAWCVNGSRTALKTNLEAMLDVYDNERQRLAKLETWDPQMPGASAFVDNFVTSDPTRISWTATLKSRLVKGEVVQLVEGNIRPCAYRPFQRQWLYFDRKLNERVYQIPQIFPASGLENTVIGVSGISSRGAFTALMTDAIPSLHMADVNGAQCFPRYIYDAGGSEERADDLFASAGNKQKFRRAHAITDASLRHFQAACSDASITKDDLFFYVYGVLHSEEYRSLFADSLSKQLPRVPAPRRTQTFRAFVDAGRKLGDLHINFDQAAPYAIQIKEGDFRLANISDPVSYFRVEKMKFAGKRGAIDKSIVIYNPRITMEGIPLAAYDYVVNGKPALEWVMERQCIKTDPATSIINDANRYANETVGDPMYPLLLFQRVITVSLETMKIVRSLPALEIAEA